MVVYYVIVLDLLQSLPQLFAEIGCWYRLCQVILDESYDFGRGRFDGSVVICEYVWLLGLINCEYLAADCKAFSLAIKEHR